MKCPLARTWANFISHRARRDISQCAVAHYFTFCGSKTFHYMHLCLQMQCFSRKKDEEFLQFFVLFLSVRVYCSMEGTPPDRLFLLRSWPVFTGMLFGRPEWGLGAFRKSFCIRCVRLQREGASAVLLRRTQLPAGSFQNRRPANWAFAGGHPVAGEQRKHFS